MKYAIYNASGEILRIGDCPEEDVALQALEGEAVYRGEAGHNDRVDPATGDLIPNGKPVDVERARAHKQAEIARARDARINAPIIDYDGKRIDANRRAIDNVQGKLAEIAARELTGEPAPAAQLVWRTANNDMVSFQDMATYKAWLCGLAVALAARASDAYAWSWQKKGELEKLATYEEIIALRIA
jgi:hypothetical protein